MTASRNLSTVSQLELQEFLNSFESVLCDCDGVVCTMFKPIPGAESGLAILRKSGKKVHFVSNNCTLTVKNFSQTMTRFGFEVGEEDVVIPTVAIISFLKNIQFEKKLYVVGFKSMKQDLQEAGFEIADYGPNSVEEDIAIVGKILQDDLSIGAVIMDFDINLNYLRLQKALVYLKRPDVLFIAGGTDKFIPFAKDAFLIGGGYFQNILQDISGRTPLQFGKPGKNIHEYILQRYKLEPGRTLFIGDSFTDMTFAANNGYQKLAVLTGVIKEGDLKTCGDKDVLPKYYVKSLEELCRLIDNKLQ